LVTSGNLAIREKKSPKPGGFGGLCQGTVQAAFLRNESTAKIKKTTKSTCAMVAAIPLKLLKPKTAAMIARTKKTIA
jgi:hypothetical protein